MNSYLKHIYDATPVFLQNIILTGHSVLLHRRRYSGRYKIYQSLLDRSEWFDAADLQDYQNKQLQVIVHHAYNTVPYYRTLFDQRGIRPGSIQSIDDLNNLPVLTRRDVIDNFDLLRSRSFPRRKLTLGHTSGTTGSPLAVLYDNDMVNITYAILNRQYQMAGIKLGRFGDRVALVRGNVIVPIKQNTPPFWRHDHYRNILLLSSFHLAPDYLHSYAAELKRFKPKALDGYPSTVYVLAKHLLENRIRLPLKAVLTSSETLYEFQRAAIEEAFECKVFDYFGSAERVVFAAECDRHQGHHLMSEFGITEIVDENNEAMTVGASGAIVGTSLHNMGMPLLRYKTSDITALKSAPCSCGRAHPLMDDVATKAEDILAMKDGRMISPSVLTHPFKPMHTVLQSQIVQEQYDYVKIKIVPSQDYSAKDSAYLVNEFKARLGDSVHVHIELVDHIPRTSNGKLKWVISCVDKAIKVPD